MHVVDRIRESAGQFAQDPAVIDADSGASWTHAQLWDRVDRLSSALDQLGLRRGDVVAAWLPNSHEAIEAELAVLQSGYVWMALNTRLTWAEVQAAIGSCNAAALIADPKCMARPETLRALQADAGGIEAGQSLATPRLILTGDQRRTKIYASQASGRWISFEESIEETMPARPELVVDESDIARLRYTSGTTGGARVAVLTHGVYLASLENLQTELHALGPSDRVLHAAPLTHASGALMYPILAAGGANVIADKFDPEVCLDLIEHYGITTMFAVPTILHRLAAASKFGAADLSSLRTLMYGGAPMAVQKLAPFIERIASALVHIYGMTEAPFPITALGRDEHWSGNPKLGSIGKPTKICELQIRDKEGNVLGDDEVGEIWIRGRNVMKEYWRDKQATREVLRDGWLASGDLGRRDADGYYWIVDRTKDVIISGGFNVYAREVEMTLCAHDAVAEAAVVGIEHPEWGETVAAFIVPNPGTNPEPEEIGSWCRERLSGYKCPRHIELLHEMPRNSSGKILKQALARRHEGAPQSEG